MFSTNGPNDRRRLLHVDMTFALAVAMLGATGAGCGFRSAAASLCGPANSADFITCTLNLAPIVPVGSDTRKIVYETPGQIRVVHGTSCVSAPNALQGSALGFRIQQQEAVPFTTADSGTVFLNGWQSRYHNEDHHVQGLGTAIVNIRETRDTDNGQFVLNWEAGGVLSDENGDDPYDWCYSYTVVFWGRSSHGFDAVAFARSLAFGQTDGSDPGNSTALRNLNGSATNAYGPGVVLPQGFALMWGGDSDRHLFQTGFDFGNPVKTVDGGLAWTSRTLLKDDDQRHDYCGADLVSVLSYACPQMLHPETVSRQTTSGWQSATNSVSLAPQDPISFCTGVGDPTGEAHYKIENVPFQYAIPVLKGWELGYLCNDHHVRQIGASITDFSYVQDPGGTTGTLFYTLSMLLSDDSGNLDYGNAVVDVFGMNARGPAPQPVNPPADAVPPAAIGCSFGDASIADCASVTAYESSRSQLCEPCVSETRVCNNGTLSGSFTSASCTELRPSRNLECP
jgi:hypothetical protein